MHTTRNSVVALAFVTLAVFGGGYLVDRARAQGSGAWPFPPPWPPRPDQIVNLNDHVDNLGMGSDAIVYDVPSDRWLVLTDASFELVTSGSTLAYGFKIFEKMNGQFQLKLDNTSVTLAFGQFHWNGSGGFDTQYHSVTGLAFHPGSKVILRNATGGAAEFAWNVQGYLAPK